MLKSIKNPIVIALAKGRILKEILPLINEIGIKPLENLSKTRKLVIQTNHPNISFLIVRTSDVPTYVQYGAADLGIVGKDTLIEHGSEGIFEMLNLGIAKCKLMTAVLENQYDVLEKNKITVATKYVHSARKYFTEKGVHVDIIKLYGSMELAPIVGLSDCIVDLVDTGNTLKANGLVSVDTVLEISTRLIANRVALKTKSSSLSYLVESLKLKI